jgi:hypothetical protein
MKSPHCYFFLNYVVKGEHTKPISPKNSIVLLHAERELMLIKLRAPAGPARTEVLQLAEIFRARVVDVSERGITLCVSGDPGKVRSARIMESRWSTARACASSMHKPVMLLRQQWWHDPVRLW